MNRVIYLLAAAAVGVDGSSTTAAAFEIFVDAPVGQLQLVAGGDDEAMLEHLMAAYKPALQVELSFANRVCRFNDEQRAAVVAATHDGLKGFAEEQRKQGGNAQQQIDGIWIQAGNLQVAQADEGHTEQQIAGIVAAAVAEHADPKQLKSYRREVALREQFRKDATMATVIDLIDQWLQLSDEQRRGISAELVDQWKPGWDWQLAMAANNGRYFPQVIPDEAIRRYLDADQLKRWQRVSKVQFGGGANELQQIFGAQVDVISDVTLEEAP